LVQTFERNRGGESGPLAGYRALYELEDRLRHPLSRQLERHLIAESRCDPHRELASWARLDQGSELGEVEHHPDRGGDLKVGRVGLLAADHTFRDQLVDVVKLGR